MLYREKKKKKSIVNKRLKLRKGDKVLVLQGKDRGREGTIDKVYPKKGLVQVGGVNIFKKHLKSRGEGKPGGIVEVSKPIPVSKVALICSKCGKKTRIGYEVGKDGKIRICKKCKAKI